MENGRNCASIENRFAIATYTHVSVITRRFIFVSDVTNGAWHGRPLHFLRAINIAQRDVART